MAGALPQFYERWLGAANRGPIDPNAFDCTNCFMQRPRGLTRDLGPFESNIKCCSFHPYLPSFTVGALIKKNPTSPEIERFLKASRLSPLGAAPPSVWKPSSVCETGRSIQTRCVFLSQDGLALCTIRDYRPSTCAGYVCRSSKGAEGLLAWRNWEAQIAKFEWTMAHLVAFELGFTLDDCADEFANQTEAKNFFERAFEVASDIPYVED